MKIHRLTPEQAVESLHSAIEGLSSAEAERRLAEFGPNVLEPVARRSLVARFVAELTHFFALVLWVAAGLCFFAESRQPGGGMFTLGIAILGVILVNGAFSFWQGYRAEKALEALEKLLPTEVQCRRNGEITTVPAQTLVPGDIVQIGEGARVPADCRVLATFGLRVNIAAVTGESLPKTRNAEASTEEMALDARNLLLAGTEVLAGDGTVIVYATGSRTEFGRIAQLSQHRGEHLSPLQQEIRRVSRTLVLIAVGLGLLFYVVGGQVQLEFWQRVVFAIGIVVAAVPEGLLPTVTLSLALASQRMSRRNALVRHLPAVETLGASTVICTDKTGTLTENRMSVASAWTVHGGEEAGQENAAARMMGRIMLRCQNVSRTAGTWHGDPLEVALVEYASKWNRIDSGERTDEIPFDGDRRRMATLDSVGTATWLHVKGAPEAVLPLCATQLEANGDVVPLDASTAAKITEEQERLARAGLRVLAFAARTVDPAEPREQWESRLTFAGLAALEDPPRPEVPAAIARCRAAGIRVIMITGDHPETAEAIARQIGLIESERPRVITGAALRHLSDVQLQLALDTREILFARIAAEQKLRIVEALRKKKEVVAVPGDGVNDAPALRAADVGIAMGRNGTDVAREAASIVLLDDNFATIVAAVEEGRAVFENIRKFLTYILTSNVPEIVPFLASVLFHIPLGLTILQILVIDLGTDMVPALALGSEAPARHVMRQRPRGLGQHLLDWRLLLRSYLFLGLLQAVAAMTAFLAVLRHFGWKPGTILPASQYAAATATTLAAIVVMQIGNVLLCRSDRWPPDLRLGTNRLMQVGIAIELGLLTLVSYTPAGRILGTGPVPLIGWLVIAAALPLVMVAEILRQWLMERVRKTLSHRSPPGQRVGPHAATVSR